MLMHQVKIGLSCLALLAVSAASCAAQPSPATPEARAAAECGGQYECIESRPMTPAEARTSLSYPQDADQQDPARVAARRPLPDTPDANAKRNPTSTPQ
jgi:hypothetical protein